MNYFYFLNLKWVSNSVEANGYIFRSFKELFLCTYSGDISAHTVLCNPVVWWGYEIGVRNDVSMVVNIRICFCQEILATGLKLQSFFFFHVIGNHRWNYCLILCEFMGSSFVCGSWLTCEIVRSFPRICSAVYN